NRSVEPVARFSMNGSAALSFVKRQRAVQMTEHQEISIIVPVLNEAPLIAGFLQHLRVRAPDAEVIVADGGSTDGTAEAVEKTGAQVVKTRPNRAAQMN